MEQGYSLIIVPQNNRDSNFAHTGCTNEEKINQSVPRHGGVSFSFQLGDFTVSYHNRHRFILKR